MAKLTVSYNNNYDFEIKVNGKTGIASRTKTNTSIVFDNVKEGDNIEIYTWSELRRRLWFVYCMFYYIISFFGIFDKRGYLHSMSITYKGRISIDSDAYLDLNVNTPIVGQRGFNMDGSCSIEENESNVWYMDEELIKKAKKLKKSKRLFFLLCIVCLVVFVIISK